MNDKGKAYEDMACKYLQQKGYTIIERNYSCKFGEIDIIALDRRYTVFVEVKFRADERHGHPLETITKAKQSKMVKTALFYLKDKGDDFYRFDAVAILDKEIEHIENIIEW